MLKNSSKISLEDQSGSSKFKYALSRSDEIISSGNSNSRSIRPKTINGIDNQIVNDSKPNIHRKNKLENLNLNIEDGFDCPNFGTGNDPFLAGIPSMVLRDQSQKSQSLLKGKNVSISNLLQPNQFLNQPSIVSNNDMYLPKLKSLKSFSKKFSQKSDSFYPAPTFTQNWSIVQPAEEKPGEEASASVLTPSPTKDKIVAAESIKTKAAEPKDSQKTLLTGTPMHNHVSFSGQDTDPRPPTAEARFAGNKQIINRILGDFNPAMGQKLFKDFASKNEIEEARQAPKAEALPATSPKFQENAPFPDALHMSFMSESPSFSEQSSDELPLIEETRTQNIQHKEEVVNTSTSITPAIKRGKKLQDEDQYFQKSQDKIDGIKAILRTAKRDKLPVKTRQQLRNKASAQISRLKKKEEVMTLRSIIQEKDDMRDSFAKVLEQRLKDYPQLKDVIFKDLEEHWPAEEVEEIVRKKKRQRTVSVSKDREE